ncbi:uncharacterized protein LOC127285023 [Leptopilina boulardi]|uniref:uncharacterized protein LOC127285023 n=1 Tax=Leptopilina boulardi TaxID=63433 RepID=UPI0021F66733|nr:uncharacterized protein LOC127285023 [Leptopilina boulardi]
MPSTWNQFYFLGLLYIPDYNLRSTGLESFFIPLEFEVWICFIFVVIFYSFFIISVKYIYRMKLIKEYLKFDDLLRIFLKQDVSETKNGGLRFAKGLMLLFGLIITMAYESMITSSFLSKSPPILFNTLTEVCESNRRFGGPKFIHEFIDKKLYSCSRNFYDSYEEVNVTTIIDMMHFNKAIMMHNVDINNYAIWVYRDRFNHRTSNQAFAFYPSLYFTKPKHPYNSLLKHLVYNFHSSGLQMRLKEKYKLGHKLCETCEDEIAEPLTISQLKFCWFALFIGWFTSCLILSLEFISMKFNFSIC